jgi:hypothetical protein
LEKLLTIVIGLSIIPPDWDVNDSESKEDDDGSDDSAEVSQIFLDI